MNWEAVGAIGELLGATAVIITLVYLAIQIRRHSENTWSQNINSQTLQLQSFVHLQSQPEMLDLTYRAYVENSELEGKDIVLLETYLASALFILRSDFMHFKKGLLPEEVWLKRKHAHKDHFSNRYAREWWLVTRASWEDDFAAEVDDVIRQVSDSSYAQEISQVLRDS